jgi:hypothetical protein
VRARFAAVPLGACIALSTAASAPAASPSATGAASPSTVAPGRSTLLTVSVTPGTAPLSTGLMVTCNLSSIGGDFIQLFSDDGGNGDAHASDSVFSYRATVPMTSGAGARSLSCVISDAQGRAATTQIALTVDASANQAPSVTAGGPYTAAEGTPLVLTAGGADPESDPLVYAWDLNDDGVFETPGQRATFVADDGPSTRWVRVRASDGLLDAVERVPVTVTNVPPTASLRVPADAQAGSTFAASLAAPADASAADSVAGFEYSFDCGAGYGPYTSAPSAVCEAGTSGSIAVGGRIRDKDGGVREYRATVRAGLSPTGLCELTRSLSRRPHVADRLCEQLAKAERARSPRKRRHHLRAYRQQVRAQTGTKRGKAFRPADGALLQRLARRLEGR